MLPPRHPKIYDVTDRAVFVDHSDAPPQPTGRLDLTLFEAKVLRRALKRLRSEVRRDMQRNRDAGWTPEPGRRDVAQMSLDAMTGLLSRLPYPEE